MSKKEAKELLKLLLKKHPDDQPIFLVFEIIPNSYQIGLNSHLTKEELFHLLYALGMAADLESLPTKEFVSFKHSPSLQHLDEEEK